MYLFTFVPVSLWVVLNGIWIRSETVNSAGYQMCNLLVWRVVNYAQVSSNVYNIREIKIHVYAKRQTSDSSWEFLRIENKQIKTVQDNCYV